MPVISITTNSPIFHGVLAGDCPAGVTIVSDPPPMARSWDVSVNVNFDVKLAVDLTAITAVAFTAWLVQRASKAKGQHRIEEGGKQISLNDAEAPKLIVEKIERDQRNQPDLDSCVESKPD